MQIFHHLIAFEKSGWYLNGEPVTADLKTLDEVIMWLHAPPITLDWPQPLVRGVPPKEVVYYQSVGRERK